MNSLKIKGSRQNSNFNLKIPCKKTGAKRKTNRKPFSLKDAKLPNGKVFELTKEKGASRDGLRPSANGSPAMPIDTPNNHIAENTGKSNKRIRRSAKDAACLSAVECGGMEAALGGGEAARGFLFVLRALFSFSTMGRAGGCFSLHWLLLLIGKRCPWA